MASPTPATGMVYVTGEADPGFPTANALDASSDGGNSDAFIAKFDTSQAGAASLLYSTFLGGSDLRPRLRHRRRSPGQSSTSCGETRLDRLPAGGRHLDPLLPDAAVRRQAQRLGHDADLLVLLRRRRQRQGTMGVATNAAATPSSAATPTTDHQSAGAGRLPDRQSAPGGLWRRRIGRLVSRIGNSGDLILTKTASPEPVTTNNTVTYTLTIGNLSVRPGAQRDADGSAAGGRDLRLLRRECRRRVRRLGQQPHRHVHVDRRPRVGDGRPSRRRSPPAWARRSSTRPR